MELNQLPEGFEGEQKRQTEFDSDEEKLTYDAKGLIEKARIQSKRLGQPVDPITFAQRADDSINIEELRAAIAKEQRAVNHVAGDTTTMAESQKRELTLERVEQVIQLLKGRYETKENKDLCPQLDWSKAEKALRSTHEALRTVDAAEKNGHEPAIYFSDETGFEIGTLAKEAPSSTRNCVYDATAEQWLAENRPDEIFNGNAESQATTMGWQLMGTEQGEHIASNTPSYLEQGWRWYKTDADIRKTGRALGGPRGGGVLVVDRYSAGAHHGTGGWGGSLRVNFVD